MNQRSIIVDDLLTNAAWLTRFARGLIGDHAGWVPRSGDLGQ